MSGLEGNGRTEKNELIIGGEGREEEERKMGERERERH